MKSTQSAIVEQSNTSSNSDSIDEEIKVDTIQISDYNDRSMSQFLLGNPSDQSCLQQQTTLQKQVSNRKSKKCPSDKLKKQQSYNQKLKDFPPRFSFEGQTRYIDKFVFYDADTFCGVMTLENKLYTFVFRCLGYDSIEKKIPKKELSTISEDDQNFLKQMYQKSYDLLLSLIEGNKSDLYQRILVDIFVKSNPNIDEYNIWINKEMLDSKLVFPYSSENLTKKTLKEQVKFLRQYHK